MNIFILGQAAVSLIGLEKWKQIMAEAERIEAEMKKLDLDARHFHPKPTKMDLFDKKNDSSGKTGQLK